MYSKGLRCLNTNCPFYITYAVFVLNEKKKKKKKKKKMTIFYQDTFVISDRCNFYSKLDFR